MLRFRVYISYHNGLTVSSDRVLEEISQLALPIRDVISLIVTDTNNNLLKEGQRFINIGGFFK